MLLLDSAVLMVGVVTLDHFVPNDAYMMSPAPRLVAGSMYYCVLTLKNGNLFQRDANYGAFCNLLASAVSAKRCRIHAYCLLPFEIQLAVEVYTESIELLIDQWLADYSRITSDGVERPHGKIKIQHRLLSRMKRVELPRVSGVIHAVPVWHKLVNDPVDYVWSGHRAYLGFADTPWLTTRVVIGMIEAWGIADGSYETIVEESTDPVQVYRELKTEQEWAEGGRHVMDDSMRYLREEVGDIFAALEEEKIPHEVKTLPKHQRIEFMCARSAWFLVQSGGTLDEAARFFRRPSKTVQMWIDRFSKRWPNMFPVLRPVKEMLADPYEGRLQ